MNREFKASLAIVWGTLSIGILAALLAPFAVGHERLAGLVPACERRARYGTECPFCGMTTSFCDISAGKFSDASHANRAGIPLYFGFVANEFCALAFVRRKRGIPCK